MFKNTIIISIAVLLVATSVIFIFIALNNKYKNSVNDVYKDISKNDPIKIIDKKENDKTKIYLKNYTNSIKYVFFQAYKITCNNNLVYYADKEKYKLYLNKADYVPVKNGGVVLNKSFFLKIMQYDCYILNPLEEIELYELGLSCKGHIKMVFNIVSFKKSKFENVYKTIKKIDPNWKFNNKSNKSDDYSSEESRY